MTTRVTQKRLVETILQECQNFGGGDPLTILAQHKDYYIKVAKGGVTVTIQATYTTHQLILEGCRIKPNTKHNLAKCHIRVGPNKAAHNQISIYDIARVMHDYVFLPAKNVDIVADAEMLLNGDPHELTSQYYLFHLDMMKYAPHLYENDSPLVLLSLLLQKPGGVMFFLERTGARLFDGEPLQQKVDRMLMDLEVRVGGTDWVQVFKEVQDKLAGEWVEISLVTGKGYGIKDTYKDVSVSE